VESSCAGSGRSLQADPTVHEDFRRAVEFFIVGDLEGRVPKPRVYARLNVMQRDRAGITILDSDPTELMQFLLRSLPHF
jgi:hypothetical protein